VILTAFTINYRRCFEFWAAYHMERSGARILLNQHGGGFGSVRHSGVEAHFVRMCDRYYSWGSTHDGDPKVKPMPSFRLRKTARQLNRSTADGPIMVVATTTARYKTFAESGVVGPHMLQYIREQERFVTALQPYARDLLLIRYFNDLWEEPARWRAFDPGLRLQHGRKKELGRESDFIAELRKCRLAVHTANETTYLEALAANFPSLIFWNPSLFEVRDSVEPDFDALRTAGILHDTPESAAEQVNRIAGDVRGWWATAAVQDARRAFCAHLAHTSTTWLQEWRAELRAWTHPSLDSRPCLTTDRS
jgi:putative transferase (TIGR04331 family)